MFYRFFLAPFFFVVFLFQIGASITDNTGLGVHVDAGGLLGLGEGCDGLGVLDGVGLQIRGGLASCLARGLVSFSTLYSGDKLRAGVSWLALFSATADLGEPQGSAYWPVPGALVGAVVGVHFKLKI